MSDEAAPLKVAVMILCRIVSLLRPVIPQGIYAGGNWARIQCNLQPAVAKQTY